MGESTASEALHWGKHMPEKRREQRTLNDKGHIVSGLGDGHGGPGSTRYKRASPM